MFNFDRESQFSGQPMLLEDLNQEDIERLDIENLRVLSIEQVRESLPQVKRQLSTLQAIVDEAHDMTEEIEILLETYPPEHPHVVEMSELLGGLVAHWQKTIAKIENQGARVAGLDPGRIEWYGVIDTHLMLYSWTCGETDIEWYYGLNEGFSSRKPLIEA
ncbi:MAG: hypothetical protein CMA67_00695 [Euryarchaeota archaeon]|nr:hypothetical protein [Euryarchaeota archaeon]|tara:strand:+ start:661 stop:1143 length:483 start_codon:yes stop_codon:yes gene_type:complete